MHSDWLSPRVTLVLASRSTDPATPFWTSNKNFCRILFAFIFIRVENRNTEQGQSAFDVSYWVWTYYFAYVIRVPRTYYALGVPSAIVRFYSLTSRETPYILLWRDTPEWRRIPGRKLYSIMDFKANLIKMRLEWTILDDFIVLQRLFMACPPQARRIGHWCHSHH